MTNYGRVRAWRRALGLNNTVSQLLPMVEECAEMEVARTDAARQDAIGDMAVTAIVMYDAWQTDESKIEDKPVEYVQYSVLYALGLIAEGIRKPKKAHQVGEGCRSLLQLCQQFADLYDYDFEKQCLGPVCDILETRLKEGYTMCADTAVKKGDS